MMPQKSKVSDAKIWSFTLESSNMILEASFTLIYYVYSTGITYDNCNIFIVQATKVIAPGKQF
jgi:hypothetical protein